MSVQFRQIDGMGAGRLGAFWASIRKEFPTVKTAQPIGEINEDFGDGQQWLPHALRIAFSEVSPIRLQMASQDDEWMLQIQANRLAVNWRKRSGQYPRFGATLARFRAAWDNWIRFLSEEGLKPPVLQLWELVYINRIPQGDLWKTSSDWKDVFPGLWSTEFQASPGLNFNGFSGQWIWEATDAPARLYVESKPGRSAETPPQQVLLLNLTARGAIRESERDTSDEADALTRIEEGMNRGHGMIVHSFDAISSASAKERWGRHASDHADT